MTMNTLTITALIFIPIGIILWIWIFYRAIKSKKEIGEV